MDLPPAIITRLSVIGLLFAVASPAMSTALDDALNRAARMGLGNRPVWKALLHHEQSSIGTRYRSIIRSPGFYLAGNGRTDAWAELEATLSGFLNQPELICRFPARFAWLDARLDLNQALPARRECPNLERWKRRLDAASISLVFASAYLNNPSSMFGHTLLRIHRQADIPGHLDYAVSFAADSGQEQGLIYAWKGLTGGYAGHYSINPYYDKLRTYARIQNRDLWQYPLDLSRDQIDLILLHLWELRDIEFDYYFLRENCAYQLLALLQVVESDEPLVQPFRWWSIPVDTIRRLNAVNALSLPLFVPSEATTLRHQLDQLSTSEQAMVNSLVNGNQPSGFDALAPPLQAELLEAAIALAAYHRLDHESLLLARSRLKFMLASRPVPAPGPADQGHDSQRLQLAWRREEDSNMMLLDWRPALHDWLDAGSGYLRGAQIEFLDFTLSHDFRNDETHMESLELVNIRSVSDRFSRPWQLAGGVHAHQWLSGADKATGYYFNAATGYGTTVFKGLLFAQILARADINRHLDRDYRVGFGPQAGILWQQRQWQILLEGDLNFSAAGDNRRLASVHAGLQRNLGRNLGLRLTLKHEDREQFTIESFSLGFSWYF